MSLDDAPAPVRDGGSRRRRSRQSTRTVTGERGPDNTLTRLLQARVTSRTVPPRESILPSPIVPTVAKYKTERTGTSVYASPDERLRSSCLGRPAVVLGRVQVAGRRQDTGPESVTHAPSGLRSVPRPPRPPYTASGPRCPVVYATQERVPVSLRLRQEGTCTRPHLSPPVRPLCLWTPPLSLYVSGRPLFLTSGVPVVTVNFS